MKPEHPRQKQFLQNVSEVQFYFGGGVKLISTFNLKNQELENIVLHFRATNFAIKSLQSQMRQFPNSSIVSL